MVELEPIQTIYMFILGGKTYYCNGAPIAAIAYYAREGDIGSWTGKTNISTDLAVHTPKKNFDTVEDAFAYLSHCSTNDPLYQYGLVKDFSGTGTLYYQGLAESKYFVRYPEELEYFSDKIKVEEF